MDLIIKDALLTNHNRPKKELYKLKALIIHYTANSSKSATAMANRNYFNTTKTSASAHYIVDKNEIIRCIPDNEMGYHVGANKYTDFGNSLIERPNGKYYGPNSMTIGIEICNNDDWAAAVELSAQLAAYLLKLHGLTVDQMYRHHDVTGKICPAPMVNDKSQWTAFKNRVLQLMNPKVEYEVNDLKGTVTIITNTLNIRNIPVVTSTSKIGTFVKGEKVIVTGITPDKKWYRIDYKGRKAYISTEITYVKFEAEKPIETKPVEVPKVPTTPVTPPKPSELPKNVVKDIKGMATILTSALNVRSTMAIEDKNKIGTLKMTSIVKVTGISVDKKWLRIEYFGKVAYIANDSKYLTLKLL